MRLPTPTKSSLSYFSNWIESFDSVSFLFLCPKLEFLVLRGNPVADMHNYREFVFR